MGDLSKHFSSHEYTCPGLKPEDIKDLMDQSLLDGMEIMRSAAGVPIYVTSGYRTPDHNKRIGGSPASLHLRGKAADWYIPTYTLKDMYRLAILVPEFRQGGIGVYPGNHFVHTRGIWL